MLLLLLALGTIVGLSASQYVPEQDLIHRRRVFDRKRPYRKFKKYISCQVCQVASQSIYKIWLTTRKEGEPDENDLYALSTEVCNPWSNIGKLREYALCMIE